MTKVKKSNFACYSGVLHIKIEQKRKKTIDGSLKKKPAIAIFRFGLFGHFLPLRGHWEKVPQLSKMTIIDF